MNGFFGFGEAPNGEGKVVVSPPFATLTEEGVTVHAFSVPFVIGKDGPRPATSEEAQKGADGMIAFFPGLQVYNRRDELPSLGAVSDLARDGNTPGANNPSLWTVGYWLLCTSYQVFGQKRHEVWYGRVGEEPSISPAGYRSFSVQAPQNPRGLERHVTDVAHDLIAQALGHADRGALIFADLAQIGKVVERVRRLGAIEELAKWKGFRDTVSNTAGGTRTSRIQVTLEGKPVANVGRRGRPSAGQGAQLDASAEEALNALRRFGGS